MTGKPYPKYKPSGVDWLGEVPNDWEIAKIKYVASIRYGIGEPPEYVEEGVPVVRATNVNAGKIATHNLLRVDPNDIPNTRIVWLKTGDIIVVRSGAYTGDSAIVPEALKGAIAGFDMVLSSNAIHTEFLANVLLSEYMKDGQIYLRKQRAAQPHLNAEELGECILMLPPLPEQQAIATFLDRETSRLDILIAKKKRLTELLAEQRIALISKVVTRGLDSAVNLKASGVEWLGEIPQDWSVSRIGRDIQKGDLLVQDGNHGELHPVADDYVNSGIPFVMANHIVNGKVDFEKCNYLEPSQAETLRIGFALEGDVLLTHKGTIGRVGIVERSEYPYLMMTPQVTYYRYRRSITSRYLFYFMQGRFWQTQLSILGSTGSTRAYVGLVEQRNLVLTFPKSLDEQSTIIAYLDSETAKIDALAAKVEEAIVKLQEYRTALISAAVTGKIDVRDAV